MTGRKTPRYSPRIIVAMEVPILIVVPQCSDGQLCGHHNHGAVLFLLLPLPHDVQLQHFEDSQSDGSYCMLGYFGVRL